MNKRFVMATASLLALAACGGKQESAATPATDSTAVTPAVADSVKPAVADTGAKAPGAGTSAKPPAKAVAPKVETGDYDQAIRPRFKVNEKTGKIDTIRKP